jgi:hypothetical protein
MLGNIKYKLNQFRHHPFDIEIGRLKLYCYYHGNKVPFYRDLTNDEQLGNKRAKRINIGLFGYTIDYNIKEKSE